MVGGVVIHNCEAHKKCENRFSNLIVFDLNILLDTSIDCVLFLLLIPQLFKLH